jgi:hypothetical protein
MKYLMRSSVVVMPVALTSASSSTLATLIRGGPSSTSNDETPNGPQHLGQGRQSSFPGMTGSDFVGMNKNVANIWDTYDQERDTPLLFAAQESSNDDLPTVEDYMMSCLDLKIEQDVMRTPEEISYRAALHEKYMGDVLATPYLHQVSEQILSSETRGRIFTVMEDPVQHAIRQYNEAQQEVGELSLSDFLKNSALHVDNSTTRQLVGKASSAVVLTTQDLEDAKSVLSHKVLVGMSDEYQESVRRFSSYFGWESRTDCLETLVLKPTTKHNNELHQLDAAEMRFLRVVDEHDIALFGFAVELFQHQALLFQFEDSFEVM